MTHRTQPFHVFYPKTWKEGYYLEYDGEVTFEEILDSILNDPEVEKSKCPAIVLNRFKEIERYRDFTVKNRYQLLDRTTGFFGLDVDNTGKLTELVKQTISNLPEVLVTWISSSKNGVKAIGYSKHLANLTPNRFKLFYNILSINLRRRSGMRINFDPAMNRCHQPIFINSDPNAFYK